MFFMRRPPTVADITGKLVVEKDWDADLKEWIYYAKIEGGDVIAIMSDVICEAEPRYIKVKGNVVTIINLRFRILGRLDDGTWVLKRIK